MSLISADTCREMGIPLDKLGPCVDGSNQVGTADEGGSLKVLGQVPYKLQLQLGDNPTKLSFRPAVAENLATRVNLGASFLRQHGIVQDFGKGLLRHQGYTHELQPSVGQLHPRKVQRITRVEVPLTFAEDTKLAPRAQTWVPVTGRGLEKGAYLVWGKDEGRKDLFFPRNTLLQVRKHRLHVPILNVSDLPIDLQKGAEFGTGKLVSHPGNQPSQRPRVCQVAKKARRPARQAARLSPAEKEARVNRILEEFRLAESPLLKDPADLAKAVALLLKHYDVFAWDGEMGSTDLLQHDIKVTDDTPIRMKVRPLNPALTKNLQEQVDKWLQDGIIEPSSSPYNFQLVPVLKKNGKTRWCVDYRQLNARTIKDPFPIGDIQSNLAYLHGSTVFSTCDALSAFHAVHLTDKAKPLTAFSTPSGHWQFRKMPFGLSNAPATYSRIVQLTLHQVPATMALPYLDDCLTHSKDLEEHFPALDRVFHAFGKSGIKLEPAKCHLFKQELTYLGHRVSKEGVSPVPEYVKIIEEWPLPTCRKELRTFMGKIGYYRRFIKDYAAISSPLNDKMVKDGTSETETFTPTEQYVAAFELLRKKLTEAPILAHPRWDSDEPFLLDTDWSAINRAVGHVVSQMQDNIERVIAYGGKRLSKTQANYSPFKGELFGLLDGIKTYKYFFTLRYFKVRNDHLPLNWIRRLQEPPSGAIQRWLEIISSYDFDVIPRKGTKHGNADAMSRAPHLPDIGRIDYDDEKVCQLHKPPGLDLSPQRLLQGQQADDDLRPLFPGYHPSSCRSRAEIIYAQLKPSTRQLSPKHPIEYLEPRWNNWVPILPSSLQADVIMAAHRNVGHLGDFATTMALVERVFFVNMKARVLDVLKTCLTCQTKTKPRPAQRHTLASQPANYPFQSISIDFVGPLPRARGNLTYILTVKDRCTRWLEAIPTTGMTSEIIKRALLTHVFSRHGIPERIHADNGPGFASEEFKSFCAQLGCSLTFSPPYNPKSNPVERSHRDLNAMLTGLCNGKPNTWPDHLPQALLAMRAATSSATGFSPFFLVHGRRPRLPLDALIEGPPDQRTPDSAERFLNLQAAFQAARLTEAQYIERMASQYHKPKDSFSLGQKVWLFHPAPHRSKLSIWWTGPWTISRVINPLVYALAPNPEWQHHAKEVVVGIDRLRHYVGPDEYCPHPEWTENFGPDFGDDFVHINDGAPAAPAEDGVPDDEDYDSMIADPPSKASVSNEPFTEGAEQTPTAPTPDAQRVAAEPLAEVTRYSQASPGTPPPAPQPVPQPAWLDLAALSVPTASVVPPAASTPGPPAADALSTISEESESDSVASGESDLSIQRPNTPVAPANPYQRHYATTAADRAERMARRQNC